MAAFVKYDETCCSAKIGPDCAGDCAECGKCDYCDEHSDKYHSDGIAYHFCRTDCKYLIKPDTRVPASGKYRKKPIVIEAYQYKGGATDCGWPEGWLIGTHTYAKDGSHVLIVTLEGTMRCDIGDYVIKGINGEFYPCKEGIFKATYEEVYE